MRPFVLLSLCAILSHTSTTGENSQRRNAEILAGVPPVPAIEAISNAPQSDVLKARIEYDRFEDKVWAYTGEIFLTTADGLRAIVDASVISFGKVIKREKFVTMSWKLPSIAKLKVGDTVIILFDGKRFRANVLSKDGMAHYVSIPIDTYEQIFKSNRVEAKADVLVFEFSREQKKRLRFILESIGKSDPKLK